MAEFIFTSQDDSWDLALGEARRALKDAGFALTRWLARGVGLAAAQGDFSEISRALRDCDPVFIRHIFPADYDFGYTHNPYSAEPPDFSRILPHIAARLGGMAPQGEPFSVQIRALSAERGENRENAGCFPHGDGPLASPGPDCPAKAEENAVFFPHGDGPLASPSPDYPAKAEQTGPNAEQSGPETGKGGLARFVSDFLETRGFAQDVKNPACVISILIDGGRAYAGVSRAEENLSAWPGGMRRYERGEERVSRAEFKLLEAAEVFSLELPSFRRALDLGAAPGGWSRILAEAGAAVWAVDPATLSEKLRARPEIRHFPMTAQEFARENAREFDLIVNDMRMDALQSALIMLGAAKMLKSGGTIIMTLKLPEAKKKAAMEKALAALDRGYTGLRAKQLFHNRSEVTVVGRKK